MSTVDRDQELLEAFRPALEAKRKILELKNRKAKVIAKRKDPRRRGLARAIRRRRAVEKVEAAELRALEPGPRLPAHLLHQPRSHVVANDLDEKIPDGWYLVHQGEHLQLGRRSELPPRAVALLEILAWCHGFKAGGCGVQAPATWWARKLACSRAYVYKLRHQLEERGLLRHFRQCRRYGPLAEKASLSFQAPDGEAQTFTRWRDGSGVLRSFVDLHGVTYATPAGVALVLRRRAIADRKRWIAAGRPVRRNEAFRDLCQRLSRMGMRLRVRLAIAPAGAVTPYAVDLADQEGIRGPRDTSTPAQGPPGRCGVRFADRLRSGPGRSRGNLATNPRRARGS